MRAGAPCFVFSRVYKASLLIDKPTLGFVGLKGATLVRIRLTDIQLTQSRCPPVESSSLCGYVFPTHSPMGGWSSSNTVFSRLAMLWGGGGGGATNTEAV